MPEKPVVVVTGAGRGIGRAIAELFAQSGYQLVLAARSIEELETVTSRIKDRGGVAIAHECDVTSSKSVLLFAEWARTHVGKVSILINNAGIAPSAKLEDTTDEKWEQTLATNLSGAFYLSRAFVHDMKELGGGQILCIASTAAYKGYNYNSAYTASKHGLLGLTRALAVELEKYHIAVNALCPGFVRTDIVRATIENIRARTGKSRVEAERSLASLNHEGRLLEPEEVANLALAVVERTDFVTGKAIDMDGRNID